ncbi:MAG: hypothetical protein KJ706_08405 [Candidatus Omnitrophica bacterium]|nr:hypothetical protein [Candidatus Omnitrophota bacterium]
MVSLFSSLDITVKNLKVGDYIINDEIVIERKTTQDFAQSIIDGRLFKQAKNMKKTYDLCLFIIEGTNLCNTSIDIHPHAVKGALSAFVKNSFIFCKACLASGLN